MAGLPIHFSHTNWPPDLVNSIERTQTAHKIIVEAVSIQGEWASDDSYQFVAHSYPLHLTQATALVVQATMQGFRAPTIAHVVSTSSEPLAVVQSALL